MAEAFQVLLAWYLADLIGGIVHCTFDRASAWVSWPVIGKLHLDAIQHHSDPEAIVRWPVWRTTWKPLVGSLPMLALVPWWPWLGVPLMLGMVTQTRTHVWAHANPSSVFAPVRTLQRLGLILRPEDRRAHHTTLDRSYCVLNGWANPLLDFAIGVKT